jgi:hypothetical protein
MDMVVVGSHPFPDAAGGMNTMWMRNFARRLTVVYTEQIGVRPQNWLIGRRWGLPPNPGVVVLRTEGKPELINALAADAQLSPLYTASSASVVSVAVVQKEEDMFRMTQQMWEALCIMHNRIEECVRATREREDLPPPPKLWGTKFMSLEAYAASRGDEYELEGWFDEARPRARVADVKSRWPEEADNARFVAPLQPGPTPYVPRPSPLGGRRRP